MDAPEVDYGDMVMSQMGARLDAAEAKNERLLRLLKACREAMNASMHFAGETDFTHMIAAIDAVPNASNEGPAL